MVGSTGISLDWHTQSHLMLVMTACSARSEILIVLFQMMQVFGDVTLCHLGWWFQVF